MRSEGGQGRGIGGVSYKWVNKETLEKEIQVADKERGKGMNGRKGI